MLFILKTSLVHFYTEEIISHDQDVLPFLLLIVVIDNSSTFIYIIIYDISSLEHINNHLTLKF